MRTLLIIVLTLVVIGCASPFFPKKTQRELDTDQCTYGVVVPHNFDTEAKRKAYIKNVAVPACLKAKHYAEVSL
ncbi:hypothetical protein [Luteibacter sp. E-22]|uniref:hypothetical protein n=1 Tax=Luteibacter sp. E-22 TaxID=3404050 RepID=UPI003CEE8F23